jgi:hypothetical protein
MVPSLTVLFRAIEDVDELFMIVKGSIEVGFEINRTPRYVIRLLKGGVIGMFNITFNRKTMFNYRVKHEFHGFTIRKDEWKAILNNPEYEDLTKTIVKNCKDTFEREIKFKVLNVYRGYITNLKKRIKSKDSLILTVMNLQTNDHVLMSK